MLLVSKPTDEYAMANNIVCEGDRFLLAWTAAEDPLATNSVVLGQYWTLAGAPQGSPFIIDTVRSKFGWA